MAKKVTRLKNMRLTSVDMVRNGANQEADICLFKSDDTPEQPTERETNILKRFIHWLLENPADGDESPVEKDYTTFGTLKANRENNEKLWQYTSALTESIRSIQDDHELDKDEKLQMMKQSLGEFTEAMENLIKALCSTKSPSGPKVGKSAPEEEDPEDEETEDPEDTDPEEEDDIDDIEEV